MKRVLEEGGKKQPPGRSSSKQAVDTAQFIDPTFSADLIRWQKQHGRHTLPWQNTRDAYRVWLSEIMLQQTQVAAVIPYYQRFLTSFPDVQALAAASAEEVMSHWSGLGYYTRARNLHQCAERVVAEYAGRFPDDPELLADLPGIGRSTAAAIAAFSYGKRAAILDGNVKRVFARVFGVDGFPGEKSVENALWLRAAALLPEEGVESYTQGLMDLGATVCTRGKPSCDACPMRGRCVALATGRVNDLPARKPSKAIPERQTVMLVVVSENQVLLKLRPPQGIWGGLLSLPEITWPPVPDADGVLPEFDQLLAQSLVSIGTYDGFQKLPQFSHTFTHFKLHIAPCRIDLHKRTPLAAQSTWQWLPTDQVNGAPLPAPVKKLLLALFEQPALWASAA
jgi:A/G-specific adenine glycosylase